MEFVKSLILSQDLYKLRNTLHMALLVSPLALLVDKKLMSNPMKQSLLLKVMIVPHCSYSILTPPKASKGLGNRKSDLLVRIELDMWRALMSVATGQASASAAILSFFDLVPWEDLTSVSQTDKDFFIPGTCSFCLSSPSQL